VVYPSNGADLKGLMKAAYYDPNPVVILEHKGLYWSKVKGTETARRKPPAKDYVLPLGKGLMIQESPLVQTHNCVLIVTYGMGVHWALNIDHDLSEKVGILDLRSLYPLDEALLYSKSKDYSRIIVLTEEPVNNSFAQSIAARIQENCFEYLDAPVTTIGSENMPAIPLNEVLEKTMLPNADKLSIAVRKIISY
jgi:2-oxoisovalerate dehydrogenase E1 component